MFKEKAIKGLICLGVIGVLASSAWAVGKKPVQEQAEVKKAQAKAQSETEKESTKETEEKGTQAVEAQAIEPKLIMEYKLPEGEEIVDVIFNEATMTVKEARALGVKGLEKRSVKEIVKVQYPKVVLTQKTKDGEILDKALKFMDKKGGILKTISLNIETTIEKETTEANEKKQIVNMIKKIGGRAILSKRGKTLLYVKDKWNIGFVDEKGEERLYPAEWIMDIATIYFMDSDGNILWEKQFRKGRMVEGKIAISDDGNVVAIETECYKCHDEPYVILYVYDSSGRELLAWSGETGRLVGIGGFIFSPNGRYLGIKSSVKSVFFDLQTKAHWNTRKSYYIYKISNEGLAEVNNPDDPNERFINLKKYLGK